MLKSSLAAGLAGILLTTVPASAADLPTTASEAGDTASLLTGGIARIYLGYIDYEDGQVDISDTQTQIIGGRGAVSIPFMDMFSIQIDALGEHTLDEVASNLNQTIADLMFAGHASYRDPSRYLIGLFGGGGWTYDNGDDPTDIDFYFVGAEAQAYWDQFTAYGQFGYLDGEDFWLEIVENA